MIHLDCIPSLKNAIAFYSVVYKGFATKIDSEHVSNYTFTYTSINLPIHCFSISLFICLSIGCSIVVQILWYFLSEHTLHKFVSSTQCMLVRKFKITIFFLKSFEKQAHIRKLYHNRAKWYYLQRSTVISCHTLLSIALEEVRKDIL